MKALLTTTCVVLATLSVSGFLLVPGGAPSQPPQGKAIEVEECRIELLKSRVVTVGASQSGVLEFVEPGEVGKEVTSGIVVAKIRDNVLQERLKAAEKRVASDIEIRYAQKSNEVSGAKYNKALQNRASYSDAEMMELKLDFEKTKLQIEKAEVDRTLQGLERGEIAAEIDNYQMAAPISGEVSDVLKQGGESVRQGDDIMQIIDTSEIRAIGRVPTRFQSGVRKGQRVRVMLLPLSPEEPPPFNNVFEGKITYLSPRVSRVSQTFEVYATVQNQRDANGNFILKEGMASRMAILMDAPRAAAIPRTPR